MSITDELREYAEKYECKSYCKLLTDIAERIDAEHQKAEDEWKAKDGQTWLRGYAECHAELIDGNEAIAESLEKAGWVKLPVDADGEPIRIGDVMESKGSDFLFGETSFEVRSMRCDECGWEVYDRLGDRYAPSLLCHHHEPTVEDVLREMLYKAHIYDKQEMELLPDLISEYAAKLRLAGDAE